MAALIAAAIAPFVAGIIGAGVLYVMVRPLQRRLATRTGTRSAAAIAVAAAAMLLLLPAVWLATMLSTTGPQIMKEIVASKAFAELKSMTLIGVDLGSVFGQASAGTVSRQIWRVFGSVAHEAINGVIACFGLYYMLVDGTRIWGRVRAMMPVSEIAADRLRDRFVAVTESMLLGILFTAILQGMAVGAAFWLVGLSHPFFWGTVAASASIIPTLGASLVWGPGVIALALQQRGDAALLLLAIGLLVISTVDNVVRPVVYRRIGHIHPLVTIVGAFAGVYWIGLVGLLLGPLALLYFIELLRIYREELAGDSPVVVSIAGRMPRPSA
jgi:predicted PurR-regulated permease PerM